MTHYNLVVLPDGRALLAASERLSDDERALVVDRLRDWRAGAGSALLIEDCDVVQVVDVEFRPEATAAAVG